LLIRRQDAFIAIYGIFAASLVVALDVAAQRLRKRG
jgi:hypothetical protein